MTDESLFAAALERPTPGERSSYLDTACDSPDQRARLESLLAAHDRAGAFLGRPAVADDNTRAAPADDTNTRTCDTDGPPSDADDTAFLAPSDRPDSLGRLGQFEVLEVLGRGGFGTVYRAFEERLQRVVAVKVLSPHLATTSPARKRFLREARSAAAVQHEHVVRIHHVEEHPLPHLVMEYIPGETLQQRMNRTGPLDTAEALRIGRQIADGLAAAHEKGLIHRDIKPSNILLDAGPHPAAKITDFGLARAADDASLTRSGTVAGTPMYMSPEQARGEALDHRSDLFSLGSVLYALLSGRPPFRAETTFAVLRRVAEDTPRPIREVIPEVPEWLCRIVEKLHAKDPKERFQTAKEVGELLADCEKQLAERKELTDFARIPGGKPKRKAWRWTWATVVAGLAVLPLLVWAVYFLTRPNPASDPTADDKARLQGRWRIVGAEYDGRPATAADIARKLDWIEFDGDRQTGSWKGQGVTAAFTLNPAADPRQIDIVTPEGQTVRGVYRFDGDRLVLATAELGADRPTSFTPGPGGRVFVATYIRDGSPADDHTRLQGRWRLVGAERLGRPVPTADLKSVDWITFAGDRQTTYWDGREWHGTFRLNTTADPREVDFLSPDYEPVRMLYRFDGDRLVMAQGLPGQPRPTGFVTTADTTFAVATYVHEPATADGFTPLFNGKDLTGWKTHPDLPGTWEVRDGMLTGSTVQSLLFSERADFGNFHLRAEVRVTSGGDSGIKFRAPFALQRGKEAWQVGPGGGYEADIHAASAQDPSPTGSVWKAGRPPSLLSRGPGGLTRPGEWFTLELIADGTRFVTKVDGQVAGDCVDPADGPRAGHLALQVFGPRTVVEFRKIEVKELPASTPAVPKTAADVLPFMAGNWKGELADGDPKAVAASGPMNPTFDFVAGGKFLRRRGPGLSLYGYDAEGGVLREWEVGANGQSFGPLVGLFNPTNRTVTWNVRFGEGNEATNQWDLVAPDTITARLFRRDAKDALTRNVSFRFTRVRGPTATAELPDDPNRPAEVKLLDRMAGEWRNEQTVTDAKGKAEVETFRVTAKLILGGWFVEEQVTNDTTGVSDYTIAWFDADKKRYRRWYFSGGGSVSELTGTWDATAKAMTWVSSDKRTVVVETFPADDRSQFRITVTDGDGKAVTETSGVARRVTAAKPTGK
jgi:uncharacterized protein (TIGR03067 family)